MHPPVPERIQWEISVVGGDGVGKSSLVIRFVSDVFVDENDPTIEVSYRKQITVDNRVALLDILDTAGQDEYVAMRNTRPRPREFTLVVCSVNRSDTRQAFKEIADEATKLRIWSDEKQDKSFLPAFLASKCDLLRTITREEMLSVAQLHGVLQPSGFLAYYETSAKTGQHLHELFSDVVRQLRLLKVHGRDKRVAEKLRTDDSTFSGFLPWNWSKPKPITALVYPSNGMAASCHSMSDQQIENYRFPEPSLIKSPPAFYNDIRQLLKEKEGQELSDVKLIGEDGGEPLIAHRILLCLRSEVLRRLLLPTERSVVVKVEGVTAAALKHVLNWIYIDSLPSEFDANVPLLTEISNAALKLALHDLVLEVSNTRYVRELARSGVVSKQMQDALSSEMDPDSKLSDVTFVVEKREFRLHRAILWSRSTWFRALLSANWKNADERRIELTTFTASVFDKVVEYLYTSRAKISPEIALDIIAAGDMLALPRLVQLAEIALHPAVKPSNAVPLYFAAEAHGAKQLSALCVYWMGVVLYKAERHEQWNQVPTAVQSEARKQHERLKSEKARIKEGTLLPCLLMPYLC